MLLSAEFCKLKEYLILLILEQPTDHAHAVPVNATSEQPQGILEVAVGVIALAVLWLFRFMPGELP
jgi:hypothetical protein